MIRQENPYKRPLLYLLAISFIILFTITRFYQIPLRWAGRLMENVLYTVQDGTYSGVTGVQNLFSRYFFLIGLHDENKRLKEEIEQLYGEIHQLQEEEVKAKHLRRLLKFAQASPLKLIAAEVIGREASPLVATIMINKGAADGIVINQGVITPRGVVGTVITTSAHHAHVLLMTDARSAIAAIIQKTREEGILHGMGQGKAHLKYLPPLAKAAEGDVLVTSGLEGRFAKGLRLGRIQKTEVVEDDFFLRVVVIPEVSLSNMEEVLVLAPPEKGEADRPSAEGAENTAPPRP